MLSEFFDEHGWSTDDWYDSVICENIMAGKYDQKLGCATVTASKSVAAADIIKELFNVSLDSIEDVPLFLEEEVFFDNCFHCIQFLLAFQTHAYCL